MSTPGFSQEKCDQRRRVAALRFDVDAVPMRFRGSTPAEINDDFLELKTSGRLPDSMDAALRAINGKLPEGSEPLKESDVYIHYLEAANNNFISDRSMFLGESTLKNIAKGAAEGVAFMNSHRTGGMSEPTELPFGKTFAGQYQEGFDDNGNLTRRAILGVYMKRGVHPTGAQGPSTDDLDSMIRAGTVADVSVGLSGGNKSCDVCGNDLSARDDEGQRLCGHAPGTHRSMSKEQIEAQRQRDPRNKKGVASYSLHDAGLNEVSAVYDGAVPGAGVRKVMALARGAFDNSETMGKEELREMLTEAFEYYGELLPFDISELVEIKPAEKPVAAPTAQQNGGNDMTVEEILTKIGWKAPSGDEPQLAASPVAPAAAPSPAPVGPTPRELELEAQLQAERNKNADAFANRYAKSFLENGSEATGEGSDRAKMFTVLRDLYTLAAENGKTEELETLCSKLSEPTLGISIAGQLSEAALGSAAPVTPPTNSEEVSLARKQELMGVTPLGRAALSTANGSKGGN